MASSLVIELVKQAWKIVEEGLKHERTAQELGKTGDEVSPMFAEIVELAKRLDLPARQIESLQDIMKQMREAHLKYSKIQCWDCCCAPCYKAELDKADKAIKEFISYRLSLQTTLATMQILCRIETTTSDQTASHRKPAFKKDRETLFFPEPPVEGLNSLLMQDLKSRLLKDDGDKVFNLTGFAGSGKTTLATQLCVDQQIQGWFNGNVHFMSVGESSGEQLASELREKWSERKGLLVVDNVEPRSEDLVEQYWKQIPSDSKILVISRLVLPGLGSQVVMEPLGEEDAITLLRRVARPIGTASCNLPDRRILLRVVGYCGGSPMAIKMIGRDLRGKPSQFWRQYLRKWSPSQGLSILDTHEKLFDHLHQSLQDSEEYKALSDFFMDLCLFPKHQIIPVSALLDMWVELYDQDEDGAKTFIHSLTAMNLADKVVQTREGESSSDAEDDVDNQFLTQHSILRDLASRYSKEQAGEFERKRLIIETNGNDIPRCECFPQQPLRGIDAFLSSLKASILQRRVAARILSITPDQNFTPELRSIIQAAETQVLVLNLRTHEYRLPEVIKEMKNLTVLIVTNHGLRSTQFANLRLLGFLKALKRIRLQKVSVPCLWEMKSLRKLSLYACEVNPAFENSSMKFSDAMPSLVELKMEDSPDLVELPAGFCDIVNLTKLSIVKCRCFTTLPQEIRKLRNLEFLRISYCDNFKEMPESISELQSLTLLDISHCRTLGKLPDDIGNLQSLTDFYMSDCLKTDDLPSSIMNLTRLQKVICDENTYHFWEVVKISIDFDLEVKTAIGMP